MADDVNITGINDAAKQSLQSCGWATEATLLKLVNQTNTSQRVLTRVASQLGVNSKEIDKIFKDSARDYNRLNRGFIDKILSSNKNLTDTISKSTGSSAYEKSGWKAYKESRERLKDEAGDKYKRFDRTRSMLGKMGGAGSFEAGIGEVGNSIKDWGKGISAFMPVVGGLTAAFGGLIKVTSSAIGMLREFNDQTRKLISAGIGPDGGFNALADVAMDTGISMQAVTELVTKFGAVAVTLTTKRMFGLQAELAKTTKLGAAFNMTQQEAQEAFMDSMEMMRVSNELSGMTNQQIVERGTRQIQMFNDLSLATGKNREELRKSTLELVKTSSTFSLMRAAGQGSSEKIQGLMAALNAEFGSSAPKLASMVEGMFRGGPGMIEKSLRPLFGIVPELGSEFEKIVSGIRDGSLDPKTVALRLSDMFANMDKAQLDALKKARPELEGFITEIQQNSQQARAAREADASLSAEERKQREKDLMDAQARQAAFNTMDSAFNKIVIFFKDTFVTAFSPLLTVFGAAGDGVNSFINVLRDKLTPYVRDFSEWLKGKMANWGESIGGMIEWVKDIDWRSIGQGLKDFFTGIQNAVKGLSSFFKWLSNVPGFGGLKSDEDRAAEAAAEKAAQKERHIEQLKQQIEVLQQEGATNTWERSSRKARREADINRLTEELSKLESEGQQIPGRARGGPVVPRQEYIVGEKGPELFRPSTAGSITPNNTLTQMTQEGQRSMLENMKSQIDLLTEQNSLLRDLIRATRDAAPNLI